MLAALGSQLPQLDPTATDDPAIALLDAWATVADIVTFYQERIANEGFLRTATERRSVLELARAIGYELRPGVAAVSLPGLPDAGPGGGRPGTRSGGAQLPQWSRRAPRCSACPRRASCRSPSRPGRSSPPTPRLNELSLRTREAQALVTGLTQLYLDGLTTGLRPGDPILVVEHADPPAVPAAFEFRVLRSVAAAAGHRAGRGTGHARDLGQRSHETPSRSPRCTRSACARRCSATTRPIGPRCRMHFRNAYAYTGRSGASHARPRSGRSSACTHPQPCSGGAIYLDAVYPAIATNSFLVLRQPGRRIRSCTGCKMRSPRARPSSRSAPRAATSRWTGVPAWRRSTGGRSPCTPPPAS